MVVCTSRDGEVPPPFTGTEPHAETARQRRALAVATPVALVFLACEILYQLLGILAAEDADPYGIAICVFVAARAATGRAVAAPSLGAGAGGDAARATR